MNYEDLIKTLQIQVSLLEKDRQLGLAIKICKDLFFDYQAFFESYEWGNPDLLLDAIATCEKALNDSLDILKIKELIPQVSSVIPDTDDFGSEFGSYGLNASAAVFETLEFLVDNDWKHITNIAEYYLDTIDLKVQENFR